MKLFGLVAAVLLAAECTDGKPQNDVRRNQLSPPRKLPFRITDSIVNFTVDLSTNHLDGGNAIFSPFSIASVLNLLLLGATSRTYDQLRAALKYPDDIEDLLIHQQSGIQLGSLLTKSPGVTVSIANRLFADNSFRVEERYQAEARDFYSASVELVDFSGKPAVATRRINQWVRDHSNGKITELLSSPVPTVTRMMATNVVYFNSSWQTPFNPRSTKARDFTVSRRETVRTDIMSRTLVVPFGVFPEHSFSVVGLPYSGGRHGMYVFLPDEVGEEALARLERHLSATSLTETIGQLREEELLVSLPRFKMSHTLSLSGVLQRMGVRDLFSAADASLRRLSPDSQLFVSDVLHQAVIDVHERGTEAAAATTSLVSRGRFKTEFRATRPFLFVIRDNKTGVPLFWGRLVRPEPSSS